jgi:hypothetical protein
MAGITLFVISIMIASYFFLMSYGCLRGPLLYSYVIQNLSWQMGFWFVTIPLGISVFLVFFFVPEVREQFQDCYANLVTYSFPSQTTYTRVNQISKISGNDSEKESLEDTKSSVSEDIIPQRKSYLSQLKIYSGTYTNVSIFKLFFRPFPFLLSPIVSISTFIDS